MRFGPRKLLTLAVPLLLILLSCESRVKESRVKGCIATSPVLVESQDEMFVVVASTRGTIAAIELKTGVVAWSLQLRAPAGQEPFLLATPVRVDNKLVVAYLLTMTREHKSYRVVVIDLEKRAVDDAFPEVELAAEKAAVDGSGMVKFSPRTANLGAALAHGRTDDTSMGYVYLSFGSFEDTQPWHGWIFEINMDAWKAQGAKAAVSAVLLTTPETFCPEEFKLGSGLMSCGGGVWARAGPQVYPSEDGFELLAPTGNGQLDLNRNDYANTLMRLGPGLVFDPACDEQLCADFDPREPATACIESCQNLFIPRLLPGDAPLRPASGVCDDKTFLECYAELDLDLGANAPVKVDLPEGPSVYVQPGKDGGVYLIDAEHMGTLHDRKQVVEICGAPGDDCLDQWNGMIVTQPALTEVDGTPVVIVPTFMNDKTHPAGLVALKIVVKDGAPRFEPFWTAPDFSTSEAVKRFRHYPSRAVIAPFGEEGEVYAWVVDVGREGERGTIFQVRVKDGAIVERIQMAGRGQKHVRPLIHDNVLYIPSCQRGRSELETYAISAADK